VGEPGVTPGGTTIDICKQDQQVPAIAGGLWQTELEICAISRLKLLINFYLLYQINKIISSDSRQK